VVQAGQVEQEKTFQHFWAKALVQHTKAEAVVLEIIQELVLLVVLEAGVEVVQI
jgi:hypothetical protein